MSTSANEPIPAVAPRDTPTSIRPVALVTGASMGIGEAFADALARRGYDLVLVSRSSDALTAVATQLRTSYGGKTEAVVADLQDPAAVEGLARDVQTRFGHVDLLVNNAGFGAHGAFETIDARRQRGQVELNVEALVGLTTYFAPAMLARGRGGIINIASTAAFQPVPFMAVYGATKAFVLSFSEALAQEFRGRGVRVLAVCPGPTSTNFFKTAGEGAQLGTLRTSEQVVQTALLAYDRGKTFVIDGLANRILAFSPRLFPRSFITRVGGMLMKPASR